MPLYSNTNGKLKKLNHITLDKEKALQKLIEENLKEVLEMDFLYSEYPTTDRGRIDTLAIDADGAPVIIEYKRNRNDNVINQALSYLKWLRSQKVEFFEMMVLKKLGQGKSINIDWNNPRIICIAESYSKYDIDTLEVIPLKLELYRFHYYENNLFTLEAVSNDDDKPIPVRQPISNSQPIPSDVQTTELSLDFHLNKGLPLIKEIFFKLQTKIFELDENIQEKINTTYIGYRISNLFAEIHIQKNAIAIHLRPKEYVDPQSKVKKVPDSYRWKLDRKASIDNEGDIDYIMSLIEQSYKDIL